MNLLSQLPDTDHVVAWCNIILALGTIVLAKYTQNLVRMTHQIHVSTERAFVHLDAYEIDLLPTCIRIVPKWKNSGRTPTRNMRNYVNWQHFPSGVPEDFTFPDFDKNGIVTAQPIYAPLSIGADSFIQGEALLIPHAYFESVLQEKGRILVWGHADYRDIFDKTPTHYIRFCYELIPLQGTEDKIHIRMALYHEHNETFDVK